MSEVPLQPSEKLPTRRSADPTYYETPLLNEPVWEWAIPAYYYIGGLTGASLALGAAAQLAHSRKLEPLIDRCHWIGLLGTGASSALLVYDLGRPERFLNMLRVFRPTSPMNMGAWILSGAGGASFGAVLFRGRRGLPGAIGRACGYAAGVFGAGLATYTGVLVANSAIPLWQEARRVLPVLFGSSAMGSVGCIFGMLAESTENRRITRAFGAIGQMAELAAGIVMEKQVSVVPRVGLPLKRGWSGVAWKTSAALTAASVVLGMLPNRSKKRRIAAGLLGTLGSLLLRFTVQHAGVVSARDARASFHQQRAGRAI